MLCPSYRVGTLHLVHEHKKGKVKTCILLSQLVHHPPLLRDEAMLRLISSALSSYETFEPDKNIIKIGSLVNLATCVYKVALVARGIKKKT